MNRLVVAAAALFIVAACGNSEPSEGALPTERAPSESGSSSGSEDDATNKAEAARSDVNCSGVKGQIAPEGAPVDDILGIRRGLGLEQVRGILSCTNSGYLVTETEATIPLNLNNTRRNVPTKILIGDNGLDKVTVQLAGLPGQEKVISVIRSLEFAEGNEKLFETMIAELEGKYGAGTKLQAFDNTYSAMLLYAGDGQRVGESNSRFNGCQMRPSYEGFVGTQVNATCGLTIAYRVQPAQDNATLARKLDIIIVDQRLAAQDLMDLQTALENQETERAAEAAPVDL